MEWQTLIVDVFEKIPEVLGGALDGLTPDDLNHQPTPDSNSIGWLVWHLARVQDRAVAGLRGEEELWVKEGWHAKFNRPPDSQDFGLGHTPKDLAAFKSPDAGTLLGYLQAAHDQTKGYLTHLSEADLDRKIDHPVFPTIGIRFAALMNDNLQHVGQVAYLRGLIKGMGWMSH